MSLLNYWPFPQGGGEEKDEATVVTIVLFVIVAVLLSSVLAYAFSLFTSSLSQAVNFAYSTINTTWTNGSSIVNLDKPVNNALTLMEWIKSLLSNRTVLLLLMSISLVVFIILYTKTKGT